jgi:hypothetical protein
MSSAAAANAAAAAMPPLQNIASHCMSDYIGSKPGCFAGLLTSSLLASATVEMLEESKVPTCTARKQAG